MKFPSMPFFKSLPDNASPPNVFPKYPEIYGPWSKMSEALMNGPSPWSQGEQELILAYAAGICSNSRVRAGGSRKPRRGLPSANQPNKVTSSRRRRWRSLTRPQVGEFEVATGGRPPRLLFSNYFTSKEHSHRVRIDVSIEFTQKRWQNHANLTQKNRKDLNRSTQVLE